MTELLDLSEGDRARVVFDPPRREDDLSIEMAEGTIRVVAGLRYIAAENHRRSWSMPAMLELDRSDVGTIERLQTSAEVADLRDRAARGVIVVTDPPRDAAELEDALSLLAEMIHRETDRRIVGGRQGQLRRQFDDLADCIQLAKTKRQYILTRATLGRDYHPWTDGDDAIFRNGTVRPLPSDFEFARDRRIDRGRRLEEAVRIFGEAERETRTILSALKARGFDVRRPHPNAQEIRVRYRAGRASVDLAVRPSPNGLWAAERLAPDNKTKARILDRILAGGALEQLREVVLDLQPGGVF